MSILNTNKLTWFKDGGEPLKSGYVYVGQPGLDPQVPANQKTVTFTDSQGNSSAAPQPLRTDVNGRVQWNGKATIATVEGDYSLLILNSSQTQITDGWTPTVEGDSSSATDLGDYREYGLLLADIKKVDVSPGQTIGSIGKTSATDDLGANWLVVSPTGGTADDIDLIDFDNGLQGERLRNFLQPQDNLDNLASKSASRSNLNVYSESQTDSAIAAYAFPDADYSIQRGVDLNGDFTGSAQIDIVKIRDLVTISVSSGNTLGFPATSTVSSDVGVVPSGYRPPNDVRVVTYSDGAATNGVIQALRVLSNGKIEINFMPRDGSSSATQTSAEAFCISYVAA